MPNTAPAGSNHLPYHNAEHARDVMRAVKALAAKAASAGKISAKDIPLLVLAACYHDYEHSLTDGNEESSAESLTTKMIAAGVFNEDEITLSRSLIMATAFHRKKHRIIQAVTDDYRTKLIADADLASLGRPFATARNRAVKFYAEILGHQPTPEEWSKAAKDQIKFIKKHRFHTPEANELFPHKSDNINGFKVRPTHRKTLRQRLSQDSMK